MYVLDTDVLNHAKHQSPRVHERILATPARQLFTSIVTVEEVFRGCLSEINASARNPNRLIPAYERLGEMQRYLSQWQVLPFDHAAAQFFGKLRARRVRVHSNDSSNCFDCAGVGFHCRDGKCSPFQYRS